MNKKYENLTGTNSYREWAQSLSDEELSYCLGRYCGPSNKLLREKEFGKAIADQLAQIINEEILSREIDKVLSN